MAIDRDREFRRYTNNGIALIVFASTCLTFTVLSVVMATALGGLVSGILAIIFFGSAFDNFEKREQFRREEAEPVYDKFHDLELFNATLKDGTVANIHVQILYEGPQLTHHIVERIQAELLREFNLVLPQKDSLGEERIPEIDSILERCAKRLKQELMLDRVMIRALDVKLTKTAQPGLFYRR
jgi:hypothetical protein